MEKSKRINESSLSIGAACVFAYFFNYCARNLLNVCTPAMVQSGQFTEEFLASVSSAYLLIYAAGQLINGIVGERIRAKYMVTFGIMTAGVVLVLFPLASSQALQVIMFGVLGFSLSMMRGPLVKTISENMPQEHARIACVCFSFVSFFGPFGASFLALIFKWNMAFVAAGVLCMVMGIIIFLFFSVLEKKGAIKYNVIANDDKPKNILGIFKLNKFAFYMIVGAIVEISSASLNFWLPIFFTERLSYDNNTANVFFSVFATLRACVPFLALTLFRMFKANDIRLVGVSLVVSATMFAAMLFVPVEYKYLTIILFLLALMCISCASAMLWSIYIPAQAESGYVSTINGVFDFTGYLAASGANIAFSFIKSAFNWNGLIATWVGLMSIGVIAAVLQSVYSKRRAL